MKKMLIEWLKENQRIYADKTVSVTEITSGEVLQARLKRQAEWLPIELNEAVMGTIFDLGIRTIVNEMSGINHNGTRIIRQLSNGWFLTGEPDTLTIEGDKLIAIRDTKLSKQYAKKSISTNIAKHQYAFQLNFYLWLLSDKYDISETKLYLDFWSKDTNKTKGELVYEKIEIPKIDFAYLNAMALEFTNTLEQELVEPKVTECSETWGGRRCKEYCDVAHICPHMKAVNTGIDKIAWHNN